MKNRLFALAFLGLLAVACEPDPVDPTPPPGPDPTTKTWSVDGSVQKGPFTQGTTITIQALDEALNPTGKNYSTKTTDDAGSFAIESKIESQLVEIMAVGYYFNEIEGKVSSSTLTLRSLSDLGESGKTNVNLLTTLETDRIRNLVKGGKTVAEARKQAEQEIFSVFNIPNAVGDAGFDKMDITKGTDADAILLAISASLQAGQSVGELSELISKIAGEVASSGKLENSIIRNKIVESCKKVDADAVRKNLTGRYTALGVSNFVIPPFEDYLDINGNGVIDKNDSWIILDKKEFVVSDGGGTFELTIQHNVDYDVSIEGGNWLSWQAGTRAYMQDSKVVFTAEANQEPDARYAVISIKDRASSHVETATVTQKQKDALTVSASSVEMEKEGGTFELVLNYNANYNLSYDDAPWLSVVETRAMSSSTIVFMAAANEGVNTRTGHIVVTMNDLSETVTVYQKGGRTLILSEKDFTIGHDGGEVNVQATSNLDYEILGPGVSWITLKEGSATRAIVTDNYTWTVSANDTGEERTATILFKDKESDLSETVTVKQTQNDVIEGRDTYTVPWEGGTFDVPVQTNTEYTPSIEQEGDWLSIVQTKALHTSTITLDAKPNTDISPRTAVLVLTSTQGSWRITITQKATAHQVTVHVPTPGTLSQVISEEDLHKIINLKITGKLNEEDLELLAGGSYHAGNVINPQPWISCDWLVEELDLSEMTTTTDATGDIFQCVPTLTKVVMPLHVEKVSAKAFYLCQNLVTVDFGTNSDILILEGIVVTQHYNINHRYFYYGAFQDCISLKTVTLPDNLEEFQAGAFMNCSGLETIIFPESCNIRTIKPSREWWSNGLSGDYIYMGHFWGCTSLDTVVLPSSVRKIEQYAFQGAQFRKVVFPASVTTIEADYLFDGCSRLEEVSLPACVTEFAPYMFRGCKALTKIETAKPITRYGDYCFDGANSAMLKLNPNIEYGSYVFANMDCESLVIPDGFKVIPEGMFNGWTNLKEVNLDGVVKIGGRAFYNNSLTTLVLPESVTEVGDDAFAWSPLKTIEIRCNNAMFNTPFGNYEGPVHVTIANTVVSATGPLFYRSEINNELVFEEGSRCEEFGIAGGSGITSISLPSSIKRLSEGAFNNTKIKSITLPENLEYIGEMAFYWCTELRKIAIPASVDTIQAQAFSGCSKLYEVTIPENSSLKYLGAKLFSSYSEFSGYYACDLDEFIVRGSETLTVDQQAFHGLDEITIGKNIKRLITDLSNTWAYYSYNNYYLPKKVYFEEGSILEELDIKGVFERTAEVHLPATVKVIGDYVFENFTGTIYVPTAAYDSFQATWGDKDWFCRVVTE